MEGEITFILQQRKQFGDVHLEQQPGDFCCLSRLDRVDLGEQLFADELLFVVPHSHTRCRLRISGRLSLFLELVRAHWYLLDGVLFRQDSHGGGCHIGGDHAVTARGDGPVD